MTNRYIKLQKSTDFKVETWPSESTDIHKIDMSSDDISGDKGFIYPETVAQRLKRNRLPGGVKYGGEIQVPAYPIEAISLLYYTLGKCTSAAGSNSLFDHVIKASNMIPSFIAAIGKDIKEHRFTGGCMKGVTIDYETGEPVLLSFDTMFRKELVPSSLSTIAFPDYNVAERAFSGAEVAHKVAGTQVHYIESASIEIANNVVDDNFVLGDRYLPTKFIEGLEITGSMELAYSDYARYEDFLDEDEPKLELLAEYGATTTKRAFGVELPKLSLNTANLPTDSTSRYLLEVEFMAERDAADDAIIIKATNPKTNAQLVT